MLAALFAFATSRCFCYAEVFFSRHLYGPSITTTILHDTVESSNVFGPIQRSF
jgi:hypothetical protein